MGTQSLAGPDALTTMPPHTRQERRAEWGRAWWVALRPSQWLKNLFVLAPLFFSQRAVDADPVGRALLAVGLFCLTSSSVYLLNDLNDREQDRLHPVKRHRPIASGALPASVAQVMFTALLVTALAGALVMSRPFAVLLGVYWMLNLWYSVSLKHVVIVDVFVIAANYLLRVVAGAVVIDVAMSRWLLICTSLLALFIALCKRRHELVLLHQGASSHRQVLVDYPLPFLDMMIGVITAAALVSYSLYTVDGEVVARVGSTQMVLTVPFVLYGFFRYLYLVFRKEEGGDPTQSVVADRPMLVNLFLWAATAGLILYRGHG